MKSALDGLLPCLPLAPAGLDLNRLPPLPGIRHSIVQMPDDFQFLHEAAIIGFHGKLFTAWYNCRERELIGFSPIRGRISADGGRTWGEVKTLCGAEGDPWLYCPPVFGIREDTLYMLINRMTPEPDHMHSLDTYRYNEEKDLFEEIRTQTIPFKLNTNVMDLANGRLFLPGRIATELDGFPGIPAGLISDSGKIDGEWRPVKFQETADLPDGKEFGYPECSAVVCNHEVTIFCRADFDRDTAVVFRSEDDGETWSGPYLPGLAFANSKIWSGTLSNGRHYVIANAAPGRENLVILTSDPDRLEFNRGGVIHAGADAELGVFPQWSYPAAWEMDGFLYVIYTMQTVPGPGVKPRGAVLTAIPLESLG